MVVGILLIQAVAFAFLSGIVANNKNRDPAGWGILGFLFGLFGFIPAIAVSEVEEEEQTSRGKGGQVSTTGGFDPDEHEKKCPMCAEYIKLEARVCKHCGHEFSNEEVEEQIEEVKEEMRQKKSSRDSLDDILATHDFTNSDTCNKCGVSMAYAENSRYECRS